MYLLGQHTQLLHSYITQYDYNVNFYWDNTGISGNNVMTDWENKNN